MQAHNARVTERASFWQWPMPAHRLGMVSVSACALALAACTSRPDAETRAKDCGGPMPAILTDSGVGRFRVGMAVADVYAACTVLRDAEVTGHEGMAERRITVVLGSVSTTATVVDDRVWRIEIASPRLRTRDSLGVGSSVGDLRAAGARLAIGDAGAFVLRSDHCGLSFQLGGIRRSASLRLADIPDSARVTSLLIVGCS
jgi:hypothetical protein